MNSSGLTQHYISAGMLPRKTKKSPSKKDIEQENKQRKHSVLLFIELLLFLPATVHLI